MFEYFTTFSQKADGDHQDPDCDPNLDPNCGAFPLDGLSQRFSSEGLKAVGWTAFLKVVVTSTIANYLIEQHLYQDNL